MSLVRTVAPIVLLALLGCRQVETMEHATARMAQESAAAKQAIAERNAQLTRYFNAGQGDSAATVYAENGVLMPPNGPAVHGRADIAQGFAGMLSGGTFVLTLAGQDVVANGPVAVENGTYTFTFTPGPNAPQGATAMADTGKYLVHWHQVDGTWYMAHDIWNSDKPATP